MKEATGVVAVVTVWPGKKGQHYVREFPGAGSSSRARPLEVAFVLSAPLELEALEVVCMQRDQAERFERAVRAQTGGRSVVPAVRTVGHGAHVKPGPAADEPASELVPDVVEPAAKPRVFEVARAVSVRNGDTFAVQVPSDERVDVFEVRCTLANGSERFVSGRILVRHLVEH